MTTDLQWYGGEDCHHNTWWRLASGPDGPTITRVTQFLAHDRAWWVNEHFPGMLYDTAEVVQGYIMRGIEAGTISRDPR